MTSGEDPAAARLISKPSCSLARNRRDYDDIQPNARDRLKFVWLETIDDAVMATIGGVTDRLRPTGWIWTTEFDGEALRLAPGRSSLTDAVRAVPSLAAGRAVAAAARLGWQTF